MLFKELIATPCLGHRSFSGLSETLLCVKDDEDQFLVSVRSLSNLHMLQERDSKVVCWLSQLNWLNKNKRHIYSTLLFLNLFLACNLLIFKKYIFCTAGPRAKAS